MLFLKLLKMSAISLTSLSYMPRIAATDPPEKPGMINATPIKKPRPASHSIEKNFLGMHFLDFVIFSVGSFDDKPLFFFIFKKSLIKLSCFRAGRILLEDCKDLAR